MFGVGRIARHGVDGGHNSATTPWETEPTERPHRRLTARFGGAGIGMALVAAGVTPLVVPVLAQAASIAVRDVTGSAGSQILITGSGWNPYDNVTVQLQGATTVPVCHVTARASGVIGRQGCTVPAGTPTASYTVIASDGGSNTATGPSLPVTAGVYTPTISALPSSGVSGQPVVFSGGGWPPGATVSLGLSGPATSAITCGAHPTADSTGTFAPWSCLVPIGVPAGSYTLTASDGSITASSAFGVLPAVTLLGAGNTQTSSAAPGQLIGISGTGFASVSSISAAFNGTPVSLTAAVTTNSAGTFGSTSSTAAYFTLPSSAMGTATVTVQDASSNTATAQLTILTPTIASATSSGISGQPVSLSGAGWPGNDAVSLYLRSLGGTITGICTVTSTSAGIIPPTSAGTVACDVPTTVPQGVYTLYAADQYIAVDNLSLFTVKPGLVMDGASLQRTADAADGQVISITGTGFAAGSTVTLTIGGKSASLNGTAATSSAGATAGLTFVAPSVPGPTQVALTDNSFNVATAQLDVYDASIVPAASAGPAGGQMSFSGNGWPGNDTVNVRLAPPGTTSSTTGTSVCNVTSNTYGVINPQSCALPTIVPFGSYELVGVDNGTTQNSILVGAASPFGMQPGVTLLSDTLSTGNYVHTVRAAVGQVVYVQAAGFQGNSNLGVSFNGEPLTWTVEPGGVQPQTSPAGNYSGGAGFTVPPVATGSYLVSVSDGFGNTTTYTLYVYNASIAHSPTDGVSGSQVTLSGSGWPANDSLQVRIVPGNTSPLTVATLCSVTTDSTGTMAPQTCTVPNNLAAGTYSIYAADQYVSAYDATSFGITPSICVFAPGATVTTCGQSGAAPVYNVTVGEQVTVAGTGWSPGTTLSATYGGNSISLLPVPSPGSTGQWTGTGFTIPAGTGPMTLTVRDNQALTASYILNVYQPTFSYSPTTAAAGSNVTVSGSGWPSSDPITVKVGTVTGSTFSLKATMTCTPAIVTNGSGTIASQPCTVPTTVPAGTYTVLVTDGQIQVTPTSLTVTPSIQIQTSGGTPITTGVHGNTVDLVGSGFAANTAITSLTFGGTTITFSGTTGATGALAPRSFTLPAAGTYTVTVKDADNNTGTISTFVVT